MIPEWKLQQKSCKLSKIRREFNFKIRCIFKTTYLNLTFEKISVHSFGPGAPSLAAKLDKLPFALFTSNNFKTSTLCQVSYLSHWYLVIYWYLSCLVPLVGIRPYYSLNWPLVSNEKRGTFGVTGISIFVSTKKKKKTRYS